jgi:hypothetical protein
MFDMLVRTYTTTYAPISGGLWVFNPMASMPMEFYGYVDGAAPVGFAANIFDLNTGITQFRKGNTDWALHSNSAPFQYPVWNDGLFTGWCTPTPTQITTSYMWSHAAALGAGYVDTKPFQVLQSLNQPVHSNTGWPGLYTAYGQAIGKGCAYSSVYDLTNTNWVFDGTRGLFHTTTDLGFKATCYPYSSIAVGDLAYVATVDLTAPATRNRLAVTDWLTFATHYDMYWTPADAVDIDALLSFGGNNFLATYNGFMQYIRQNVTIGTKTTPDGFIIVMSPDGSVYYILRLIAADSGAVAMLSTIGQIETKTDLSGALWLKNANLQNTLLVSAGSVLKVLPIYLPVPLSDSRDTDPALQLMRSAPNGTK